MSMPAEDLAPLPLEISRIISERPPHWECRLLQSALRLKADKLNSMFERATRGIDAPVFSAWTQTFLPLYQQLVEEWTLLIEHELATVTKAADPDLIIKAVDHLVDLTRDAIILQQRATALAQHPVFGTLAAPLRQMAKPFIDAYNDLLHRLDDQLANIDVTHHLDLRLTLGTPPALEELTATIDNYTSKFIDEQNQTLRTGDVVKESFHIARGEERLGEFGRRAIVDSLTNGLFRPDDWYWSDDSQQWKPLANLP
jgi:hypothetical protein